MMKVIRGKAARNIVLPLAFVGLIPMASGCFGSFELTKKVYDYNRSIDGDKWVQWGAFLVLNIIPVYGVATWIDALFANSVEFWTGRNPIVASADGTQTVYGPNGEVASATVTAPGVMDLTITDANGVRHSLTLVGEGESVAAYDDAGRLLGRAADLSGTPALLAAVQ